MIDAREGVGLHAQWTLRKWHDSTRHLVGLPPDETLDLGGNLALNEGLAAMLTLLIGGAETAYSNANARIGVGTSTTAAAASQTGIQTAGVFKAMDATFPSISSQTVTFQSTFGSADANQAWEEASVDNGATANKNLNRKVQAMGTKASGTTWVISVAITAS